MDQIKIKKLGKEKALEILGKTSEEVEIKFAFEKRNDKNGRDPEVVIGFVARS
ncbi:MAG: hypothetical protein KGH71_01460 [Candidatus Micrarchaeota archaeon]|nr:hypothetical protein [Candidatus Micrarchaeota archaeon]